MLKSILITGASSGIGAACCEWLLARGYQVFAGMRTPKEDASLKQEYGERYQVLALDVTDPDSISAATGSIQSRTNGQLFALINNAGVAYSGALETLPIEQVKSLFDVNVLGTFAVTQAFIPMLRTSQGRVVVMGSISGLLAAPGLSAYSASKFALEGMCDSLRNELNPFGISVTILEPGKIETPIWRKALQQLQEAPADKSSLYQPLDDFYRHYAVSEKATPMNELLVVLQKALEAEHPKARYTVGRAARIRSLLMHLPTRLRDSLLQRAVPITNKQ
ncbi:MAG: SDR family oxidoreductase [Oleibacter sp.]|nr:SDR family oxidoreductase [Thalassolituus sp.]